MKAGKTATTTKWRRATKREALNIVPVAFTLAMLVGVAVDAIFDGSVDYEHAFYRAIYASIVMSVAFRVLKWKAVSLSGPLQKNG